jgi:hypothetical protein
MARRNPLGICRGATTARERVTFAVLAISLSPAVPAPLHAAAKERVKVESTPSGAMVSVSSPGAQAVTLAGVTPLEKTFAFPKRGNLTLTLEKRGHVPRQVEIAPGSGPVRATFGEAGVERRDGDPRPQPPSDRPRPSRAARDRGDQAGFSREGVDPEASREAEGSLQRTVRAAFERRVEVRAVELTAETREPLKALWRDGRTALQLADPVRLPYLAWPPYLETSSSRKAAALLGRGEPQAYLFLLDGKQVRDTAGMKLGQLAVLSVGTAASYGSGHARAMGHGDSLFVYNVYIPDYASGLTLKAALVDAATGELLWLNRGNWNAVRFDEGAAVGKVVGERLTGLP